MRYSVRIDGVQYNHADTRAEAKRQRDAMVYCGLISDVSEATIVLEHGAPAESFTVKASNLQPGMTVDFDGALASDDLGNGEYVGEATVMTRPIMATAWGFRSVYVQTPDGRFLYVQCYGASDLRIVS